MFKDNDELDRFFESVKSGKQVEVTAREMGLDAQKALEFCKKNAPNAATVSFELYQSAGAALAKTMQHLAALIDAGPRESYQINKNGESKIVHNTDMDAAKELGRIGLELMKIGLPLSPNMEESAKRDGNKEQDKKKLFGPWKIKGLNC